jgi:hypothetical protein
MKKILTYLFVLGVLVGLGSRAPAYDFGDMKSSTLVAKAWDALKQNDTEGVLAYTNKCLELYADKAKEMQAGLKGYVTGNNDEIFKNWALNDVATAVFIQGEAYRRADMKDEAKGAFQKVINEYSWGQTWDPNGWFWKPAEAAKEKLAQVEGGANALDFGDYTSAFLVGQAWRALEKNDKDAVMAYTGKVLELYEAKAKEMQASLTEYPWQSREQIFKYWALNDVGTALYIQGEVLRKAGDNEGAKKAFQQLIDQFSYAQCWDPQGWFWKPAEAAREKIDGLGKA